MSRRSLRSSLYKTARLIGDAEAAERGPEALAERVLRRKVYRVTNRATSRFLRLLGLQGRRRR